MKKIVIAIDGNSGSGKSTTAKAVARALGYLYIDSGAMYRAVTLYFLRHGIDLAQEEQVRQALAQIRIDFRYNAATDRNETYLNDENVEEEIRGLEVSAMVSPVSEIPAVRRKLVDQQRRLGGAKGVVMDGRDIGTVVFPDAELKVFMTADLAVRAERRRSELQLKQQPAPLEHVIDNLKNRDRIDSTRADSPLKKADDAVTVDTSGISFEQQVNKILDLVKAELEKD
jgi:CMP/dCMP kinase